jgi:predicted signal transduction protein with EAL and GGDEF domain
MKRRVLLTLAIAPIAICGATVSYAFLTELWAVVSIAAIFTCTGALLYLVWSPKRDKAASPNFGVAAVTSIATLSSGPIWSGLLKVYSSDLEKVGIPAQYLDSFAREFFATTLVAIFGDCHNRLAPPKGRFYQRPSS